MVNLIVMLYSILLLFIGLLIWLTKGLNIFLASSMLNTSFSLSFWWDMDQLMIYFIFTVIILSFIIVIYSSYYMSYDLYFNRFMFIMLLFIISMLILNSSTSCWMLWLGWEGLGITSFMLIIYYSNWKSNNSSVQTLMLNRVGDFSLMLSMTMFCYSQNWNLNSLNYTCWFTLLVIMAIFAKSAQIPFQSWLPAAMAAPTPVSSLVHSSTLVVAGSILCLKLNNYFFNYSMVWLSMLGFLTSLYASFMAFIEQDFKKIMAYSTMSQIALVMFMLNTNLNKLLFMHIVNHAFAKALLFMNVGVYIMSSFGLQELRLMKLKVYMNKISSFYMITCLLSMCGFYYLSCLYSKEFFLCFSLFQETILLLINLTIFLSLAYSFRMIKYLMMSSYSKVINVISHNSNSVNIFMFFVMFSNGWFMVYNYIMPIDSNFFVFKKNYMMLIPFVMIILSMFLYKNLKLLNLDLLYQAFSMFLINNSIFLNYKSKFMSLSYNMFIDLFYQYASNMKLMVLPIFFLLFFLLL
uniref:NADH:ubiquinone reductase (H(+)-translocating) n=1 Tax=Eucoleus annulatus TaxID=2831232 RepID=A0A8E8HTC6_9BILA|nr:NADH dehydrogenase subunit 5 [Eucoleus annulatus]QWC93298.1 NADH dehydrogenase subunit 5 [Eucoleus annulatus]